MKLIITMDMQRLKGFLAVARYGSFSKAAEKTFRTQPAVSLQVRSLEEELGAALFDRLGRGKVMLTDDGKALLGLVGPLFDGLDTLKTRFDEARGKAGSGVVRIATPTSVMVYLLPEVIRLFRKRVPHARLSVISRGRKDILAMLDDGDVDMGIASLSAYVPPTMDYKVFARFDRILIAPKGHALSRKSGIGPEDIARYPLLVPPIGGNTREMIDRVFKERGLQYTTAMEVAGREAVKIYVEMGLGISIINEYYLDAADRKWLFVKNVSRHFGTAERGVITKKARHLSLPAKFFIDLLFAAYKSRG